MQPRHFISMKMESVVCLGFPIEYWMTPEGCPSWIRRSVVSIIGVELRAACPPVIRSPGGSRSTCRLCWLSMLQCCGKSTWELITFSANWVPAFSRKVTSTEQHRQLSVHPLHAYEVWCWHLLAGPGGRGQGGGRRRGGGWVHMFLQLTRPPIFTWKACA